MLNFYNNVCDMIGKVLTCKLSCIYEQVTGLVLKAWARLFKTNDVVS